MKNKLFYLASLALTVISFAKAATPTEAPKVPEVPEVVAAPEAAAAPAQHSDAAATPATIEALPPVSLEGTPPASETKESEHHDKNSKAHSPSKKRKKHKKNKGVKVVHHGHHKGHHHKHKDLGGDITNRLNHEIAESAAAHTAHPTSSETPVQPEAAVSVNEVDIIQAN